jgi:glutathione S-transferase
VYAFARMLEEHAYWAGVYSRWIDERYWPAARDTLFAGLPPVLRSLVPALIRRQLRRALYLQGMGRHTRDEIYAMGAADIDAVAAYLGDKPFFMGERPSGVDATVFAFIAAVTVPSFATPLKDAAMRHGNLLTYVARLQARYFGAGRAPGTPGEAMLHTGA